MSKQPTLAAQLAASQRVIEAIGDELGLCWHEWRWLRSAYSATSTEPSKWQCRRCPEERVDLGKSPGSSINLCLDMNAAMPVLRAMLAKGEPTAGLFLDALGVRCVEFDGLPALDLTTLTAAQWNYEMGKLTMLLMQPHHIVMAAAEVPEGESDA